MSRVRDAARDVLDVSLLDAFRFLKRAFKPWPQLSPERRLLLATMRRDNAAAGAPYAPSRFWSDMLAKHFDSQVNDRGLANAEEQDFNFYFSGFPPSDARLHRYVCWLYQRSLEQRDHLGLLDRLQATCQEARGYSYRFEERKLSLDLLLSIDDFYNLLELQPAVLNEPIVMAEVGAGWGRLAHVVLTVNPRATYLIFDLPEPLLISQAYLPRLLNGVSLVGYDEAARRQSLSRAELMSSRLWFFGAHHLERLERGCVDISANIASFQEMPLSYVEAYMRLFSETSAGGHVYLRQLFDRRTHGHEREEITGLSAYPFPATWHRKFLRPSRLSDEVFEAGFSVESAPL